MKPTSARKASLILLAFGVVLLAATLTLPNFRFPQSAEQVVSASPGASGYQIHGFGIPTVTPGTQFTVALSGFESGRLQYSLSPTVGNRVLPALSYGRPTTSNYTFTVIAADAYSLELSIITYNGTGFTVRYSGVWSPFDFLAVYLAPAVFLIAASLVSFYYFGTRIPRQLNEEAVARELEESRRSTSQGASIMTNQVEGRMVVEHPWLAKNPGM